MALKDCIKKLKGLVSKEDIAQLEQYIAEGMNDDEAVHRLTLESDYNVVMIGKRAFDAGAAVERRPEFLAEIRDIQSKRFENIRGERVKLEREMLELHAESADLNIVTERVRTTHNVNHAADENFVPFDIYDDQHLNTALSSMLFDPELREGLRTSTFTLKGKGPEELVKNFKVMRDRQYEIRQRIREILVLDGELVAKLGDVDPMDRLFQMDQSELGLRSGLLSAVRIMPQAKGPAGQMIAYLKKQPGVKKEELEWIGFEQWANAKGTVTRDEMILYVQENGVQVLETQYGGSSLREPELIYTVNEDLTTKFHEEGNLGVVWDVANDETTDTFTVYEDQDAQEVSIIADDGTAVKHPRLTGLDATKADMTSAIKNYIRTLRMERSGFAGRALWEGQYQLDGGTNYREVVLHLPDDTLSNFDMSQLVAAVSFAYDELNEADTLAMQEVFIDQQYAKTLTPEKLREVVNNELRAEHIDPIDFEKAGLSGSDLEQAWNTLREAREAKSNRYVSHTFGEVANILAWMRIKDRIGPNGEKILFIEEVQSDWHSAGRESGYAVPGDTGPVKAQIKKYKEQRAEAYQKIRGILTAITATGAMGGNARNSGSMDIARADVETEIIQRDDWLSVLQESSGKSIDEFAALVSGKAGTRTGEQDGIDAINTWRRISLELSGAERNLVAMETGIPDAPFKGNAWAELAMKRIIRLAAEGGYDQIAWTTGEQQADRYDLRSEVDEIVVDRSKRSDYEGPERIGVNINLLNSYRDTVQFDVDTSGKVVFSRSNVADELVGRSLREIVGAELAETILDVGPGMSTVIGTDDLEFGGEGMKTFYDKVLVNVTNRAARKLDKKAGVERFGGKIHVDTYNAVSFAVRFEQGSWIVVGMSIRNIEISREAGQYDTETEALKVADRLDKIVDEKNRVPVHKLDVTGDITAGAMEGLTLFQKERGSITFDEMRRGLIRLTETRNQSTFLHEAGHLYLEVMRSLAEGGGAPQEIMDDWQTILDFLGVTEGRQITPVHHEKWARSWEKYLQEGKAPSIELQDAFNSFKQWLTLIYSKLKDLVGIELNDEIRGVFDRILASEQQIAQAEQVQQYAALFNSPEEMGVSREAFEVYRESIQHAHQEGVDKETARMLKAMKREEDRIWKIEKAKVREEVEAEAHATKVYIALAMLQRGTQPDGTPSRMAPFKINKASLLRLLDDSQATLNQLPRPFIYSLKGGVDIEVAAQTLNYKSGQELITAIMQAPPMKAWITGTTEQRMLERHPDPMLDGSMADKAVIAVHSQRRASVLATEMRALRERQREDAPIVKATTQALVRQDKEARDANLAQLPKKLELAQLKAAAIIAIGKKKLREVQPHVYLNGERRAGRLAFEAMKRKDYAEAAKYKRQQIVNFEMYRAAVKAKKQYESTQKYLVKFESTRVQKRLGKSGMLDQILAVIEGVDLRKRSLKEVDRLSAMKTLREMVEDGRMIVTQETLDKILSEKVNWQDLTVDEFQGMRDIVRQLEHEAKTKAEAVVNGQKLIIDEAVDEMVESVLANNKVVLDPVSEPTGGEGFKKSLKGGAFRALSTGSIGRILDNANWGAVTRLIVVPMRRAQVEKLIPWIHQATEDIVKIYTDHYSNEELGGFKAKKKIEGMEDELSKSDILSIGLHWGSEGNRRALLAGMKEDERGNKRPAYPEQGVQNALATLDARDWAFIQAVWDYNETYWNDLLDSDGNVIREGVASTERRRRGISPEKVEAMPFTIRTSDGKEIVVKGGFMHLSYDPRHGDRTKSDEIDKIFGNLGNGVFVSASTRAGSTFERTQQEGRVVKLGLSSIDYHLHSVIRDLALGDEVDYLRQVLNHPKFRAALKGTNNTAALDELNLWLTDAAVGEMGSLSFWDKLASYTRVGFVKSRLAFSATVTALQLTGFFQSMVLVGRINMMRGLGQILMDPAGQYKSAMETSTFLTTRYGVMQAFSQEAVDTQVMLQQVFGPVPTRLKKSFEVFGKYYFYTIMRVQSVVDVVTWQAALWKARNEEGLSKAESILYADALVEGSQTSGIFSDRAAIERGTLGTQARQNQFVRLWTTLIGYMLRKQGLFYERASKFNRDRSFKNAVDLSADFLLLFTIEGIASQLIYGNMPDGGDDDEVGAADIASWVAVATVDSIVSGIPIVREVGTARYGSGNTPLGTITTDIYKLLLQSSQLELDEPLLKAGVKVGGTLLHLPSAQTNRFIDALLSEDDSEWYEYVLGERD